MGTALLASDRPQPRDGDLVIAADSNSLSSWNVSRYQGPAQLTAQTRQDAVVLAEAVAGELAVDVWSLEHGVYLALSTHRQPEGTAQPRKVVRRG